MSTSRAARIGVLGGTFDPIHAGHLAAARVAAKCARLDQVILVPAARPPHRPPAIAAPHQRLEMCMLALTRDPHLAVSDLELNRSGLSYTVDTLAELQRLQPGDELFLILGWDAARLFHMWHKPDEVRALASIVIVGRPGAGAPTKTDLVSAGLGGEGVILCLEPTPDVAASEIRRAVAAGESITGKVPAAVEQYIAANRLYAR